MKIRFRHAAAGLLAAFALLAAPVAMARSAWNVGLNFGYPGVSIGYSNWSGRHHGGWGASWSYRSPAYYGGWNYYAPRSYYSYYPAPRYYGGYYAPVVYRPAYYPAPRYYGSGYAAPVRIHAGPRQVVRDSTRETGYARHRAEYYDRSGYGR